MNFYISCKLSLKTSAFEDFHYFNGFISLMFTRGNTLYTNWNIAFFTVELTYFGGMLWAFSSTSSLFKWHHFMFFDRSEICIPTQCKHSCMWQMSQNIGGTEVSQISHRMISWALSWGSIMLENLLTESTYSENFQ